jgi:hypothetical protein
MSRSLLSQGFEAGVVVTPHFFPSDPSIFHFKDDVTFILLLGISFMIDRDFPLLRTNLESPINWNRENYPRIRVYREEIRLFFSI